MNKKSFLLTIMKISLLQLSIAIFLMGSAVARDGRAQVLLEKVTLNETNKEISEVLNSIEKLTNARFIYSSALIQSSRKVSFSVEGKTLQYVLDMVLPPLNLSYEVSDNTIVLNRNSETPSVTSVLPELSTLDVQAPVTGTVTDEQGEPLPGVSVKVKGSSMATTTDANGKFSINIPDANATLVFTYIGFTTQEVALNGRTSVTVQLKSTATALNEVVVVGYGSVQKRELTSAVTTVNSKDFLPGAVNSPLQMIEGKVGGVTISNPAAADPNRSTDVQVRGAASVEAGNGPLIVINGMPGGDLRNVAQQDIESITVLKDASAAAIYGSRGANGVILVQTKKGRAGKVTVTYDSYIEKDVVAEKPDILSPEEFLAHKRDIDFGARTNWYDQLIRKDNFGQNHYLSVAGGSENTVFRISGNFRDKSAIDIASDRREYGFNSNFQQKALDGLLEFGGNISYRIANEEFTNYGAFQQAVKLNPTIAIMDPNDPLKYNTLQGYDTYNPVQDLLARENGADNTYSIVDLNFKLNILKNLNTELKLARQGHDRLGREYYTSGSAESVNNGRTGRARLQDEKWTDYTLEWLGNYYTHINKHDIKLMGGYSYQEFNNNGFWAENMNFPSDAFGYDNLDAGSWNRESGRLGMDSWRSKEKTIAFLGRANYSYDDTYFLTASARYEGNTKFGKNNKWGLFPAVSAAWRISRLPAIQNIKAINDLKLRVSYGETGRSGFPRYTSLSRYTGYGRYLNDEGEWIQVYGPANNFNPNLQWEKAISYNIGLDFSLFNNKLSGSLDAFNRKSTDLLSNYDVPVGPYVQEQIFVNVGSTSAKGLELNLNWNAVDTKNFTYNTSIAASYTKAKLTSWSNDEFQSGFRYLQDLPSPGNPGPAYRLEDGVELGSFYGYKYAGVDENGKFLIWKNGIEGGEAIDATNEGNIDRDRVYLGHGAPHYELGWGNTLRYKNVDLSLFFRGRFDYKILNLYQMYYGLQAEPGVNLLEDAYTKNGHITSGKVISDYYLENGDYLKLDNLTLGWSPKLKLKRIDNLRLYGTIRNVFTLTNYSGLDPTTVGVTGLTPGYGDLNVYPITRTFSIGAQITF
ncbi:SusC/RagA family TonB-linked outer membrane protein [Rubrolithibacter danxiaensis]|uniref:SusC/RagA family TonB-linked outer membrane protein n=1 Tax=Rubrolithibacter danxiaensis TaxID=3390805 RepID=UPI003BF90B10